MCTSPRVSCPELGKAEGMPRDGALQKSKVVLTAYGGAEIIQFGAILIRCEHKGKRFNCIFYVIDRMRLAILGLKACEALELVSLHCALETKVGHSNKVTRDYSQMPRKGEDNTLRS